MTCLSLTFAEAVARYGDRLAAGFDLLMDDSDGEARTCLLCARRMTAAWRVLLLTERQRWWFERPLCAACAARGWATCRGEWWRAFILDSPIGGKAMRNYAEWI